MGAEIIEAREWLLRWQGSLTSGFQADSVHGIEMTTPPVNSVAGPSLPLDASFDLAAWGKNPPDLVISDDIYEREVEAGRIPPVTPDVGAAMLPHYGYTEDEMGRMIEDREYCQHVVQPIPPSLMDTITLT
ncbi:hypothetical protein DFH08DRAFT_1076944 [Mycena albidolilacea]|uniref:Uncharacterized protein n=1 Tax=Mycena albidolilacea TaxID=1033008 RepID=A0AAD7EY19_9AGAR|nr:hypothetical protein DFH08DRAFT_1076944 [Mycena albidolilacea]